MYGALIVIMDKYAQLHDNQREIVDYIVHNPTQNVLVTGAAGTGKSWVRAAAYERCKGINTIQIGPTGPSVYGLRNSYTLMLFLGAERGMSLASLIERGTVAVSAAYLKTAQIFLEEVALMNAAEFDALHAILCRVMGRYDVLFGGIRTVLFFDVMQLKPASDKVFYESKVFAQLPVTAFRGFRLKGSNRIKDVDAEDAEFFERVLTAMRDSDMGDNRVYEYIFRTMNRVTIPTDTLHICATNKLVDHYNTQYIDKLTEMGIPQMKLKATRRQITNTPIESIYIEKEPVPQTIVIGKGSRVQFTSNCYRRGSYNQLHVTNGTFGTVQDIIAIKGTRVPEDEEVSDLFGKISTINGKPLGTKNIIVRVVLQDTLEVVNVHAKEYTHTDTMTGAPLIHFYQWPLALAFATTVHRVQGMSLDKVCVVGTSMSSASLAYTACSRARTLRGLYGIKMHPQIFAKAPVETPYTRECLRHLEQYFTRDASILPLPTPLPPTQPQLKKTNTAPLSYIQPRRTTYTYARRMHPYTTTNTSKEHRLSYS